MNSMRKIHTSLLALGMLACMSAAQAQFTPITQPDAAYTGSTSVLTVTEPDFTPLSSLSDGIFDVSFSSDVVALTAPTTWATWGAPPNVESGTPRVLWSQGATDLTLTFSRPVGLFGLEAQPNTAVVSPITAEFYGVNGLLGTITLDVDGFGGANLFAASSDRLFTSVRLFSTDDFGIAQLRYGAAVPEPGTVTLLLSSLLGAGFILRGRNRG